MLNFKISLPSTKLDMAGSRLTWNGLIFSGDIPVDFQLTTLLDLLLSNIRQRSIWEKNIKFW